MQLPAWMGACRIRQRLTDLAESLTAAGLPTQVLPDRLALEAAMWRKLAINASINPLTAAHGCVNGEIARDPPLREWAKAISTEVCSVGRASGQALLQPDECWASVLDAAVGTASNRSSMLQDMESGRQLELPAINGAVAKLAEVSAGSCARVLWWGPFVRPVDPWVSNQMPADLRCGCASE